MARFLWTYAATAFVMVIMDGVWLSLTASRLYRAQIGSLMLEGFNVVPAILFYVIFVAGLVVFVGLPSWDSARWTLPLWRGALFGLVTYATYDLTNQATLRGWSWLVTGADLAWGMSLCGVSATLGLIIARALYTGFSK
jgi:uncharacterized membrane protein